MQSPVAITRSDLSGLTWVALDGELDLAGAGLIGGDLMRICDARAHVVIDARGLRFIDLSGLRLIAGLERRQRSRGARFSLVSGEILRRLARLGEMIPLLDSEEDPDVLLGLAGPAAGAPRAEVASGTLRAPVARSAPGRRRWWRR